MLSLFMAELKARSLSIDQAAKEMGIEKTDLVKQLETILSQNTAEKISSLLGTSAEIWLSLSARQQAIKQSVIVIDMGLDSGGWVNAHRLRAPGLLAFSIGRSDGMYGYEDQHCETLTKIEAITLSEQLARWANDQ